MIGGAWFLLERTRQTALHAADATLQNAALIVESVVNRQLLQVDGALVSLPTLFSTVTQRGQEVNAIIRQPLAPRLQLPDLRVSRHHHGSAGRPDLGLGPT